MQKVQEYVLTRDSYLRNALEFIGRGEYRKASEFLWRAIAIEIKLLALIKKNMFIASHREIREFIRLVTREIGDVELYKKFQYLEKLHTNFYDETIDREDMELYIREALEFIKKLEELAKRL